ncbi:MAG TPA: pentapeptide repeat-containing protein [Candidatus Acidoferrales bacterium]|nr:pentapeptide repeat-containing protein [Candidatus Acidoferrales bacterium]
MAYVFKDRGPPPPWSEFKRRAPHTCLTPFYALSWFSDWAAYALGKWPFVELLEYLGSFSILFAAIVYFVGAPDRLKQKHYQAWQVINTAEGKGGNGGRIDALEELNRDHVSLIGVNVAGAYLQDLRLEGARARRATFGESDLRDSDFQHASLPDADFHYANLRRADLHDSDLAGANFADADLVGADFSGADLAGVTLDRADLRDANLAAIKNWQDIKHLDHANILGVRNAPAGFVPWAVKNGAVELKTD